MSLLEASNPTTTGADARTDILEVPLPPAALMVESDLTQEKTHNAGIEPHDQARALIRLIQCVSCSKPFTSPVTLPCGNTVCRACLPTTFERKQVTYPDFPGRRRAIQCPFPTCLAEHTVADCSVDVTLSKVMEAIGAVVLRHDMATASLQMDKKVHEQTSDKKASKPMRHDSTTNEKPVFVPSDRGRLVATYNLAVAGGLLYDAETEHDTGLVGEQDDKNTDEAIVAELADTAHKELDCQLCYNLMLDPVTTGCGHTLCRHCLIRALDHAMTCPVCRRVVLLPPSLQTHASNTTLNNLINGICPQMVAARAAAVAQDESGAVGELDTPLFVVTLGFPGCPTFLRVFEPRYRLMLRRAVETNRQFGIVMYNRHAAPQGDLGHVTFMEYGTLLRIENAQIMPDGTSIVETRGIAKFRVKRAGSLDGYSIGSVERVEDIPLDQEERIEVQETSLPPVEENDWEGSLDRMSTRSLLMLGLEFIVRMQARSAPWLHERILSAYGGPPDDPANFPYWFASILPISDDVKYEMLKATSVRQRLKITAKWIHMIESQRWYQSSACTVL